MRGYDLSKLDISWRRPTKDGVPRSFSLSIVSVAFVVSVVSVVFVVSAATVVFVASITFLVCVAHVESAVVIALVIYSTYTYPTRIVRVGAHASCISILVLPKRGSSAINFYLRHANGLEGIYIRSLRSL